MEQFWIQDAKISNILLDYHKKLLVKNFSHTKEENQIMDITSYVSESGSVMYDMVCSRHDLASAISMVNHLWQILVNFIRKIWSGSLSIWIVL